MSGLLSARKNVCMLYLLCKSHVVVVVVGSRVLVHRLWLVFVVFACDRHIIAIFSCVVTAVGPRFFTPLTVGVLFVVFFVKVSPFEFLSFLGSLSAKQFVLLIASRNIVMSKNCLYVVLFVQVSPLGSSVFWGASRGSVCLAVSWGRKPNRRHLDSAIIGIHLRRARCGHRLCVYDSIAGV